MNLPNSITMSRIVMIPLLLWILSVHFPYKSGAEQEVPPTTYQPALQGLPVGQVRPPVASPGAVS